jgi:nucleoside-diphosphate-sugar epimerase
LTFYIRQSRCRQSTGDFDEAASSVTITGGSGRLGSEVLKELMKHGYDVISLDFRVKKNAPFMGRAINLNHYDEVLEALQGCDAVIHLAAYPDPYVQPGNVVFSNNVVSTYNILDAASTLGISKAVIASSESSYGFPWAIHPFSPNYFPVDEEHPQLPQECYGLSKKFNELTGEMFHRRTGMQVVSLRLSTILTPEEMGPFITAVNEEPGKWKHIFWSYIDVRDAATACRLACEANELGAVHLNITADNTCCKIKSKELIRTFFPEVPAISFNGYEALYSNAKAKQLLGWTPAHLWHNS